MALFAVSLFVAALLSTAVAAFAVVWRTAGALALVLAVAPLPAAAAVAGPLVFAWEAPRPPRHGASAAFPFVGLAFASAACGVDEIAFLPPTAAVSVLLLPAEDALPLSRPIAAETGLEITPRGEVKFASSADTEAEGPACDAVPEADIAGWTVAGGGLGAVAAAFRVAAAASSNVSKGWELVSCTGGGPWSHWEDASESVALTSDAELDTVELLQDDAVDCLQPAGHPFR